MHPLSVKFHKLLEEAGQLHDAKQKDYGHEHDPFANVRASEDFGVTGWIGCMMRGNDKMKRIQKAAQGRILTNESLRDSLMDLGVYCLIAVVLLEEESTTQTKILPNLPPLDGLESLDAEPSQYTEPDSWH